MIASHADALVLIASYVPWFDEDGAPARRRRYVIVEGKSERSGVLNDQGEAEIELAESAQIFFPDVDKPREA